MAGNLFECYHEQSDRRQYTRTVEALEEYTRKYLKYPEDLMPLFAVEGSQPILTKPPDPGEDADEGDKELWKEDIKDLSKRRRVLRGNLMAIQAVIWGQCSEAMKAKIKSLPEYKNKLEESDCYWFMINIKAVTMQFDAKHKPHMSLWNSVAGLANCRQQPGQTTDHYLESYKGHVDTIEYHGGTLAFNPDLAPTKDPDDKDYTNEERKKFARDEMLGVGLIRGADPARFGTLITDLANQYIS